MAVKHVRALINNASFPYLYEQAGRAVVNAQDLAPRMPGTFYGSPANQEVGVPAVVFAENVLPLARGFISASFAPQAAGPAGPISDADQAIPLRDTDENQFLFVPARGDNWVYNPSTVTWASKSPFTFNYDLVTRAYVNGRTFVFYEKTKLVEYNATTSALDTLPLVLPAGYAITDIRGIGSAGGYLLLFTDVEILWCSPLNVLDFSDLDGGAGAQIPADLKGQITAILPISKGAIVYSTRNAVGARLTNNSAGPFVFTEISGAGGLSYWERAAADSNEEFQFAWTTSGLQQISLQTAQTIEPEATDFLVGGRLDYWDAVNKAVVSQDSGGPFSVKLALLAARYLVISYGTLKKTFDFALVFDVSLRRWGKLRFEHADAFMYTYPSLSGDYDYDDLPGFYSELLDLDYADLAVIQALAVPAKRGVAFLKNSGEIWIMATDYMQAGDSSTLLFGHLQHDRGRDTTLHRIELEGIKSSPEPTVSALSSETGYGRTTVTPAVLVASSGNYRNYNLRVTAKNHDIAIEGCFTLTGLLLEVVNHGSR